MRNQRQNGLTVLMFVAGVLMLNPLTSGRAWSEKNPGSTVATTTLENRLRTHVDMLADSIGERNIWCREALFEAAGYIERFLVDRGYDVKNQTFETEHVAVRNLEVEIPGSTRVEEIIVVGAHYDSVVDSPGANDNASGVAGLLEIARLLAGTHPSRTIRLVTFVNEEPPFFQTGHMGSRRYAKRCRESDENIVGMLSLETIGYYSQEKGSQGYPFPFSLFYPDRANFIGFIGNLSSRALVQKVKSAFEKHSDFPCESTSVPGWMTGIGWSDHWAFWKEGYRAIMVTDTALFRYPYYHTRDDTPDKLDFGSLARVVEGLAAVTADLAGADDRIGDAAEHNLRSE